MRLSPNGKAKASKTITKLRTTGVPASRKDYPQSTNVSSPVPARYRKNRVDGLEHGRDLHKNGYARDDFVVSDDGGRETEVTDDDDEDAFEPIREFGKPEKSRRRPLGPPITTDEKLDRLNETHRMIVDDFVIHARKECERVRHRPLFSIAAGHMLIVEATY